MVDRRPAEVFHPGEHLLDELNARGWTQIEFSEIIDRPPRLVNEIVNGKKGITPETAREFGAALGTSAEFWINLDTAYRLWKSTKDVAPIKHRAKMRSMYPVREMINRGWIRASENTQVEESQLLRFFGIGSLEEHPKLAITAAMRRTASDEELLNPIQIAWLYRVKHIAETMRMPKYSKRKLTNALQELETYRTAPEEIRNVPQLLEKCGVRFVIVEPLPNSKIDGVCFWPDDSPIIGMTLRYDRIDNFWFVLRHEIAHVLNGDGKDSAIIDSDVMHLWESGDQSPNEELIANDAAAEFCVSQAELENFIARKNPFFSRRDVVNFATRLGVHPGLVVGQLQRKTSRYDLFRNMLVSIRQFVTSVAMTDGYGNVFDLQI